MAIKTIITCDVCQTEKKKTNKWWAVWMRATDFSIQPWHTGAEKGTHQVCSRSCVQKLFENWMEAVGQ